MELIIRDLAASSISATSHEDELHGRKYLVVPIVALVEGVRTPGNIGKPELGLMSEFRKSLDQWNGRPIVLNHPRQDGDSVSANVPAIYDEYACGLIFNANIDGKKLKMDAWIDLDRAETAGGDFQNIVDRVKAGDVVEVSTGFMCNSEPKTGRYLGEKYESIWRDIIPDHLALLPDQHGACNIEDGCGTRENNASKVDHPIERVLEVINLSQGLRIASKNNQITIDSNSHSSEHSSCCAGKDLKCDKCTVNSRDQMSESRENSRIKSILQKFIGLSTGISDADLRTSLNAAIDDEIPYGFVIAVYDDSFIVADWMNNCLMEIDYEADDKGSVDVDFESMMEVRPMTQYVAVDEPMDEAANSGIKTNEDGKKGRYGDVKYADPGYQKDKRPRYPIDTAEHIRAAWNYINKAKNGGKYSSSQLKEIKSRIIAAWKEKIDKAGPPSAQKNNTENSEMPDEKPNNTPAAPVAAAPAPAPVIATLDEYVAQAPESYRGELSALIGLGREKVAEVRERMNGQIAKILKHPDNTFTESELRKLDASAVEKLFKLAGEKVPSDKPGETNQSAQATHNAAPATPPPPANDMAEQRRSLAADDNNTAPAPAQTLTDAIKAHRQNGNGARA